MWRAVAAEYLVVSVLVVAFSWDAALAVPDAGLDRSWQAGLHMAAVSDLRFGVDIVFTYGPLGFLKFPANYYVETGLLAWLYTAVHRFVAAGVLYWAARSIVGSRVAAALLAWVGATTLGAPQIFELGYGAPVSAVVFALCAIAVRRGPDAAVARALPWWGAVVCAIEVQAKLSIGVLVGGCTLIALLAGSRRRLRDVGVFAAVFAVAFAASWFAAGQSAANLEDYLVGAREIASGYAEAMGGPLGTATWLYVVAAALLAGGGIVLSRGLDRHQRAALVVLFAFYGFVSAKASLVAGGGHMPIYFASMLAAWFAFSWSRLPAVLRPVPLVVLLLVFSAGTGTSVKDVLTHDRTLTATPMAFAENAVQVFRTGDRRRQIDNVRERLREVYSIEEPLRQALDGRRVHIDPWEATVAWAFGLRWKPLPVIQAYSAYTRRLDLLNREALVDPDGPETVLREPVDAPLGRLAAFESPAAVTALLCTFAQVQAGARWQVLERRESRCGEPRILGSVRAGLREPVPVPRAAEGAVLVRIRGVRDGFGGRIGTILLRSDIRTITIDGRRWRLVPGTAENGLLLSVPPAADYPPPYSLGLNARTISVDREGHGEGEVTYEFLELPIAPFPAAS